MEGIWCRATWPAWSCAASIVHMGLRSLAASAAPSSNVQDLVTSVLSGQRLALSKALTLCESTHPQHQVQANSLLGSLASALAARRASQHSSGATGKLTSLPAGQSPCSQASVAAPNDPTGAGRRLASDHATSGAGSGATQDQAMSPGTVVNQGAPQHARRLHAMRIGVSGPPGAGKSSLIETLGLHLCEEGSKVAVLAVDPSSHSTGGAILGDKTRMGKLSNHPSAYVRPSPARGTLGGVARATADALVVCEAAGYDTLIVETVGVGQSETSVSSLVDCMLLVMPPVGGDELQMIKRGIMEAADIVAVNKADGATEEAALRAVAEYTGSLGLLPRRHRAWRPVALPVSAKTGYNVAKLASLIASFESTLMASGELLQARRAGREQALWQACEEAVIEYMHASPAVQQLLGQLMPRVHTGEVLPRQAAQHVLEVLRQKQPQS